MNRVARRAGIVAILILMLLGGMGLFLVRYIKDGTKWVNFSANPHIYSAGKLQTGIVTDRNGKLLLDLSSQWSYSEDPLTRQSSLHWLGDREGNIAARLINNYSQFINGYETFSGLYSFSPSKEKLMLTLDANVQNAALEALQGRKGTVAVYNYKTGEILCAVSSPTFDPDNKPDIENDSDGVYTGAYFNRFLQSTYTPGSIFKLATTAAALECIPEIRDMTFTCTGQFVLEPDMVTCGTAHGDCTLEQALAKSCNCSFAQIALLIGRERLTECVEKYGLTESVAFDGLTSSAGSFDISNAADVELAWSAIGQYTDQISPCGYLAFVGSIAAGGKGVLPHIVRTAGSAYQAAAVDNPYTLDASVAQILADFMENNTNTVYGQENFHGLTVCAKSGTAEVGEGIQPHALFTGFVRSEQYPLAFLIIAENSGYGASNCIPILSQVLDACIRAK